MRRIPQKAKYFVTDLLQNRPLCFMSAVGGLRDLILGIGFIIGTDYVVRTVLYDNFTSLMPGWLAGTIFALLGLFTILTAFIEKIRYARWGLRTQSLIWLFSGIMYAMDGAWVFAFFLGGGLSISSGYLAYYYKYAPLWREQKRQFRDDWIKEHDPFSHITEGVDKDFLR